MNRFVRISLAFVCCVLRAPSAVGAADAPASTAFSAVGRVEFSQGGRLTVGNDILALSAPDFGRQIENTDVPLSVELYAMGQRTSWKGRFIGMEKFLEPQGDGSFTVTWALDLKPCGETAVATSASRCRPKHSTTCRRSRPGVPTPMASSA